MDLLGRATGGPDTPSCDTGLTASQVALRLGLSPATVSRLLALLKLPETVQGQVDRKELAASTAYEIGRTAVGANAEQERLAAQVVAKGTTRDAFTSQRAPSVDTSRIRVVARLDGERTVTLSGAGLTSLDRLVEWLEELLARARKARPRGVELSTFLALLRDEAASKKRQRPVQPKSAGGAS